MASKKINILKSLSIERLNAFSDGVFAIAITLLVLGIAVPEVMPGPHLNEELTNRLIALFPKVLSFGISFTIIGIFWFGHHLLFQYIKKIDRNLIWLNIFLLMVISFIPFPAALLGEYGYAQPAILIYGLTLLIVGILFATIWWYAARKRNFIDDSLDDHMIKKALNIILLASMSYFIAIVVSFFNPFISLLIYVLIPILYIIPSPIDEFIK
ncbi:DUF1211 domain-containing protein [Candidatus Gottesmanbacteria bacterium]|nr:DUF1211 domain-containing protein [Candidatus Gottesmanbacteria bacterium]